MNEKTASLTRDPALVKTAAYYIVFIIIGLSAAILGPTLPWLADNVGVPLSQISLLFAARSLGGLLGSALGGRLFDRRPGHPVAAGLLLLMAATLALVPAGRELSVLVIIVFLLGIGEITLDLGGNTLLMWVHGNRVAPYMNGLHFFFGVGSFLSPIIVAQAIALERVSGAYWLLALLIVPIAGVLLRLSSPSAPVRAPARSEEQAVSRRLAYFVAFFFLLYVGAEVSFGGWVFSYAVALDLATEVNAAYLTSAFWGALTIGRLLAVPISTRFTPRPILLTALLGALASVTLILLRPDSSPALWVGACGLGLFMAPIFPTMLSFAERRMPITGQVTGWFFVGATLGAMVLPWLSGQLFTRVGPQAVMVVITCALLAAVTVFALLSTFTRRRLNM